VSVIVAGCATLVLPLAQAQTAPTLKDVVYATVDGKDLGLDLHMPPGVTKPALLVWVHGGVWRSGTKANPPMAFVENGFAMASLDFRQSGEARFPTNVHDIKAAIRFLRGKASEYGYRVDRIAIAGSSSGAHLAVLVGVTNGHKELEGTEGGYLNQSSDVAAILDYYGASNLMTILAQSTPFGVNMRRPALELLLGATPDQVPRLGARQPCRPRRPQRSAAADLSRRSGPADADQSVARAAGCVREDEARRVLRRGARCGARREPVFRAGPGRARRGVSAPDDRRIDKAQGSGLRQEHTDHKSTLIK
jgi:acetyl esterase/lipase